MEAMNKMEAWALEMLEKNGSVHGELREILIEMQLRELEKRG